MGPTRHTRATSPSPHTLSTSLLLVILVTLLTTLSCLHPVSADTTIPKAAVVADLPQPTVAVVIVHSNNYLEFVHEVSRPNILEKRQGIFSPIVPPGGSTSATQTTASPTPSPSSVVTLPTASSTTVASIITTTTTTTVTAPPSSTSAATGNPITTRSTILSSTSLPPTTSASPTESKPPTAGGGGSLTIVAAAVGGLTFMIGAAIVAFKCVINRKDRQRRNKEIAATLAESFDRSGGSDKYHELGDGPGTPIPAGAKLSRQGSQQEYYPKEGSDYYNNNHNTNHYVQERYGGPNGGYDETEMSVMGSQGGASPMSPYMGQAPSGGGHHAGYNDYDYDYGNGNGNGNGGYNQGHQQGGYGYGQRY
ncbi:hypothetical protein MVEG_01435 [Podila verticillata NRRL 6337]|nr:hypothetical protein MVEG_01435 [Podila verticillata NRRL 6337]